MKQEKRQKGTSYGSAWKRAREVFLLKHPLCAFCAKQGIVTAATVVDHIIPHRGDQKLFWDRENWMSLCTTHHQSTKQAIEKGRAIRQTGIDGWPE